jgi:uncharacterized protein DUF4304
LADAPLSGEGSKKKVTGASAQQAFNDLLEDWIEPTLKASGFQRRGNRFYRDAGDSVQLVDFQRSMTSTHDRVRFTVNLGVESKRLAAFFESRTARSKKRLPSVDNCHWKLRLDWLVPDPINEWFVLDGRSDVEQLGRQLLTYLRGYVLPGLEAHGTDAALANLWLSGQSPGLTDFSRLLYLAVLLHDSGSKAALDSVMRELDELTAGDPTSAQVDYLRERLQP